MKSKDQIKDEIKLLSDTMAELMVSREKQIKEIEEFDNTIKNLSVQIDRLAWVISDEHD